MAGQPFKKEFLARLEKAGGVVPLIGRVAAGEAMESIAASFGVSRGWFSWYLNRDDRVADALFEARHVARKRRRAARRQPAGVALQREGLTHPRAFALASEAATAPSAEAQQ